ncbi:MAG: glycosyltransferase family 2 protein [Acidobacteriota bacterium]|nr:glycosyltransferase family 2 protein [Acidobacteriota bacterium]
MSERLFVSVIVPAFNAGEYLGRCLGALSESGYENFEVLVVDDASTDGSAGACRRKGGVIVLRLTRQSGPAAARNYGAREARGDILFFVDSDVLVRNDTLSRVVAGFHRLPDIAAVFGSYDNEPGAENFLSQYKNLYHHFVHQRSSPEASTFWAGCGAIRREAFESIGGFNESRYAKPSIEDIELGDRLRRAGHRIFLDKELQVKHLKHWSLASLIRADIFYRAVPWSKLLLENGEIINDLNLRKAERFSAGLAGLSLILLPLSILLPALLWLVLLCWLTVILINRKLYLFFLRERGFLFAVAVFPLQLLYYIYSAAAFAWCWCSFRLGGLSARFSRQRG